jgi:hypothetical protein
MALPPMAAARQALVSITGIDGYFSKTNAISKKATANKQFDGGSSVPEILMAPAEVDDITVSRPFRPGRDAALLTTLFSQVNNWYTSISVQWTDGNLSPNGSPVTGTGWLTGVDTPEVDAGSGDAMMLQLTFSLDNVA